MAGYRAVQDRKTDVVLRTWTLDKYQGAPKLGPYSEVKKIPKECGFLRVVYQNGHFRFPHEDLVLCDIETPGTIIAHWLRVEGDHISCYGSQGICEGNHEIDLDSDINPTCESLGTEDFYGHSWGFLAVESDSFVAHHYRT